MCNTGVIGDGGEHVTLCTMISLTQLWSRLPSARGAPANAETCVTQDAALTSWSKSSLGNLNRKP